MYVGVSVRVRVCVECVEMMELDSVSVVDLLCSGLVALR